MIREARFLTAFLGIGLLACAPAAEEAPEAPAEVAVEAPMPECYLDRGTMEEAMARMSPLTKLEFSIGGGPAALCYGAPSARGRQVANGLIPYGELWRMGADEATTIHLTTPAQIGGVEVEPGSYSLYVNAGEEGWEFFVSSSYQRWGIPITDEVRAAEMGSFTVEPESKEDMTETMTFRFEPDATGTMGDVIFEWDTLRASFHVHPTGM
jgi:hypothetical protein